MSLHLIHPPLVHFTVAFLVVGGLCEAFGILRGRERAERFGAVLVLIGTVFLVPTVASGLLAENTVSLRSGEWDLELHERVGFAILAVFLLGAFAKAWVRGNLTGRMRTAYAILLLIGVALVVAGSLIGGHLVYDHGIGVSR